MFEPLFNTVLVELNDEDAKWGRGNDDNLGGEVFNEGTLINIGYLTPTADYPLTLEGITSAEEVVRRMMNKTVMWNEGHEAGTVFEHEGKKYAMIYWWDLRGVKSEQ